MLNENENGSIVLAVYACFFLIIFLRIVMYEMKATLALPFNSDINLTCTQCGSNFITSTAVYTRWGKSSCTDDKNTTTVYHGK